MEDYRLKDESISKVENNRKSPGKPKGLKKSGGRQPGTPNKKTLAFSDELETHGFNLSSAIVSLFNSTNNEVIKLHLIELVAKYKLSIPKAKEAEEPNDDQTVPDINASDDQLLKLAKA